MTLSTTHGAALARFEALLRIVCCPYTKKPLTLVDADQLSARLPPDQRVRVQADTIGAFVSEAAGLAFPIVGRIADFLEQDALRLADGPAPPAPHRADDAVKQHVKAWYDEFGWKRNEQGLYNDSVVFAESGLKGNGLYTFLSHLVLLERLTGGEFLLDAASGAIAHPEYLAYSWFYKHRVCVDMSMTALQEADRKLRANDFCCLADICHLPFREESFDAAVSGYTIQHIPAEQQGDAARELHRVLRRGSSMFVITGHPRGAVHRALMLGMRARGKMRKLLGKVPVRAAEAPSSATSSPGALYFFVPPLSWWHELARELGATCSIQGLRLFEKFEFDWLFGESNESARAVRAWERKHPKLTARLGPAVVVELRRDAPSKT